LFLFRNKSISKITSYDPVDRIILDKNHIVCGQQIGVQKASTQRSSGNMRSRSGPPSMSRPYGNHQQQNTFNNSYRQMPNNNYERGGGGGPMRRGNMRRGGYAPYNTRDRNEGSSWTSWD
jgi:hypothetical protein